MDQTPDEHLSKNRLPPGIQPSLPAHGSELTRATTSELHLDSRVDCVAEFQAEMRCYTDNVLSAGATSRAFIVALDRGLSRSSWRDLAAIWGAMNLASGEAERLIAALSIPHDMNIGPEFSAVARSFFTCSQLPVDRRRQCLCAVSEYLDSAQNEAEIDLLTVTLHEGSQAVRTSTQDVPYEYSRTIIALRNVAEAIQGESRLEALSLVALLGDVLPGAVLVGRHIIDIHSELHPHETKYLLTRFLRLPQDQMIEAFSMSSRWLGITHSNRPAFVAARISQESVGEATLSLRASMFGRFIEGRDFDFERFAIIERAIGAYLDQKWSLDSLLLKVERSRTTEDPVLHNICLVAPIAARYELPIPQNSLELFPGLTQHQAEVWVDCVRLSPADLPIRFLSSTFQKLLLQKVGDNLLEKLPQALGAGCVTKAVDLAEIQREIMVRHILLHVVGRGVGEINQQALVNLYHNETQNDSVPFTATDPRAVQMRREIRLGFRRMIDNTYAFNELTFDARSLPDSDEWSLVTAARELGAKVFAVHASSSESFPGRGILIDGIDPARVMPDDRPDIEAHHRFKSVVRNLGMAAEVDLLKRTKILLTRGLASLYVSDSMSHLDGTKYCYTFFSEHFKNYWLDLAFHVPLQIMSALVKPSLVPYEQYNSQSARSAADINKAIPNPRSLRYAAMEAGLNLLNMGSGGNLGGSFSNAYPPQSRPFHRWEERVQHETKDAYGHVHKSHMHGFYDPTMTTTTERELEPLRQAHAGAYTMMMRYQNLLDLVFISLAHHNMGVSVSSPGSQEFSDASPLYSDLSPINLGSFRRLRQAYLWHHQLHDEKAEVVRFPVIALVATLKIGSRPRPLVTLDSHTMIMKFHAGTSHAGMSIPFPTEGNGRGFDEQSMWADYMMPLFRSDRDIRLYDRRQLESGMI